MTRKEIYDAAFMRIEKTGLIDYTLERRLVCLNLDF